MHPLGNSFRDEINKWCISCHWKLADLVDSPGPTNVLITCDWANFSKQMTRACQKSKCSYQLEQGQGQGLFKTLGRGMSTKSLSAACHNTGYIHQIQIQTFRGSLGIRKIMNISGLAGSRLLEISIHIQQALGPSEHDVIILQLFNLLEFLVFLNFPRAQLQ